jgi:cell wall-associated NlpC family hydrolase
VLAPPSGTSPQPPLANGSLGDRAVALAERYLGVPYVWAGADPLSGFDCSGLVMYVYAQLGISLPHASSLQWRTGKRIARRDLRAGDLLLFEPTRQGPGHVGIYVGQGRFIEAPHTGEVVKFSSLNQRARALDYVGAVRPY